MFGYSLVKTSHLNYLRKCEKDYVGWYVGESFDKTLTDKQIIAQIPEDIKSKNIHGIFIDRKQNKVVVLIK